MRLVTLSSTIASSEAFTAAMESRQNILVAIAIAGIGNLLAIVSGQLPAPFELCILKDMELHSGFLVVVGQKTFVAPALG